MRIPDYNLDPPEAKSVMVCPDCGNEIYAWNTVYELEQGYFVCEDCFRDSISEVPTETLADHFDVRYMTADEIIGGRK